jgi:Flp pilus assembly pilin Flp
VSAQSSKPTIKLHESALAGHPAKLPDTVFLGHTAPEAKQLSSQSLKRQAGQGMTEYIIIVALVAVAAIAVYQYLGQVLRAQTAAVAKELAGEDGTQQSRAAQSAAESAAAQAAAKSLKDFTGHAAGSGR